MRNSTTRIMRWLLGLAAVVSTSQVSYATVCPGTSVEIVSLGGGMSLGQPTIHVGNSYTSGEGVLTNSATCGGVGENVTLSKTVLLVPACTVNPSPGTTCSSPDAGVITVTAASSVPARAAQARSPGPSVGPAPLP